MDGLTVVKRCVHCLAEFGRHRENDPALVALQCQRSATGHRLMCQVPDRQPVLRDRSA